MNIRSIAFLLFVLFTGFSTSAQQTTVYSEANLAYKRGMDFFESGLYGQAQIEFARSIEQLRPNNETASSYLKMKAELFYAKCAVRQEQPEGEKLILDFVRKYAPDPIANQAVIEVGNYYYNAKEYERAISFFSMLDNSSLSREERSEVKFKQGYAYFVQKKFKPAMASFKSIKDIQNKYYYPSNYYYGMTAFFESKYDEAIRSFRKVEKSKKYKPHVPYYITQIYFAEAKYDQLLEYAVPLAEDKSIRKGKEIHQLIGQAYFEKGDYPNALPHLEYYGERTSSMREEEFYQLGFTQYKTGHYQKAIKNFEPLGQADSELGQNALYNLGDCYIKTGKKASARNAFASASRMTYDLSVQKEARFNYGKLSYELSFDRDAINALQSVKPDSPHYPEAQDLMSKLLLNTRDYDNAIKIIEGMPGQTNKIKETYQIVTYRRGLQLYRDGNSKEGKGYFTKSLNVPLDPMTKALATYWLGEIAHENKNYDLSIRELNKFLTYSKTLKNLPDESSVFTANYTQGYNYLKQKKYNNALGYFQEAVAGIKRNTTFIKNNYVKTALLGDAVLRAGDCLFKRNKYDDAVKFYDEAINKRYEGFVYAYYQKAIIEGLRGRTIDKILALEQIEKNYPNSEFADDALLQLGITYQEIGEPNKATPPLRKIISNYKTKSDLINRALLRLGLISYNKGSYETAINYYKQIFSNNPTPQEAQGALTALEEIYVQDLGKPEEYFAFLETIPGYDLDSYAKDSINFKAAESQFENGNYDRAIQAYTNYINKFPNGRSLIAAYYNRGESYSVLKNYSKALSDYEFVVGKGQSRYYLKALNKAAIISYNHAHNFEKAFELYEKLEKAADSDDMRFEAQLGALRSGYRINNAAAVYKMANKVTSNSRASNDQIAVANFYLGKMAADQKDYDKALSAFNQVIRLIDNEQAAEARYNIAYIYYLRRNLDTAEQLCINVQQESQSYQYWVAKSVILMADILAEKGDLFNARAALESLIENYDGDQELVNIAKAKLKQLNQQANSSSRLSPKRDDDKLELEIIDN